MKKILSFILAVAGVLSVASCTVEEVFSKAGKTPLETPVVTAGEVSASSISFYWTAVDNASQYSYKVLNPAGYVVAKGETTENSVLVKGLKFSTEFNVSVIAVPTADAVKTLCSSDPAQIVIKTDDPIIIDYEWVQDGYSWFYQDGDTWNKVPVTFGLEKGTGHFVITSYSGAEGFDFYFDLTAFEGSYPFEFNNGMKNMKPVEGQAIDTQGPVGSRPDFYLAHGLGGKSQEYNIFYGDGGSYEYGLIDPTGGYIDFWTTNFDAQWCGYRVEFGDYKAPEPEPWTPDPDMTENWTATGEISIDGKNTKTYADITFDAATGEYTLTSWYGVEGYDLVFTRNQEDGTWIINNGKSSAFASECPGDGLVGYLHGAEGSSKIIWVKDDAESGLEGTDESGQIWLDIVDPAGEEVRYSLVWPAKFFTWTKEGKYYSGRHETTADATLGYDEDNDTYTLVIPQYDDAKVIFKTDDAGAFLPLEGGSMYKSDDTWWYINYADTWVYVKVPACSVDLTAGNITLDVWNVNDEWTDTFTCQGLPGVDSLVGTYAQSSTGWWWDGEWKWTTYENDVTITKVDATTIAITGLNGFDEAITAKVNAKTSTLTMAAGQILRDFYYFSAYATGEDVYASYDAEGITFTTAWRLTNETGSLYWDNFNTTLTKK